MQPPQPVMRRLLARRPLKVPTSSVRLFTRNTQLASTGRPQMPFLSVPMTRRNQQFRYLTTERKRWLAYELTLGFKYSVYLWAMVGFSLIAYWSVQQEWLERKYPTPHEWGFITRLRFRLAKWSPNRTDVPDTNWVQTADYASNVVARLEDPKGEGAGIADLTEGGVWIADVGKSGYDITAKSEPWRRGYYEALMLCAKSAEHLDDRVVDRTRKIVFPAEMVIGPSNPNPRPIPHGAESAPREEDCDPVFDDPQSFYLRILTTRGFTPRQKMDAALACASWLDYKQFPDAAERMYQWALAHSLEDGTAASTSPNAPLPYDEKSYVLGDATGPPSANLLTTLTAFATHKARNQDIAGALPMLISILRARRSLPSPSDSTESNSTTSSSSSSTTTTTSSPWAPENMIGVAKRIIFPPSYPPIPDQGNRPPTRDPKELCEEASLNLYIGEIIYSSGSSSNNNKRSIFSSPSSTREEGLAWTREAVDLAEEQLYLLHDKDMMSKKKKKDNDMNQEEGEQKKKKMLTTVDIGNFMSRNRNATASDGFSPVADARSTCRQCLDTGLDNWYRMASKLAREEKEEKEEAKQKKTTTATTTATTKPASSPSSSSSSSSPTTTTGDVQQKNGSSSSSSSWIPSLWGSSSSSSSAAAGEEAEGRWAAEVNVVKERTRRAQQALEDLERPAGGIGSLLSV